MKIAGVGRLLDEAALARAHAGTIDGAGFDVFAGEPNVSPALLAAPRRVASPHLGSATGETRSAMEGGALTNLEAWLAGHEPPDRVAWSFRRALPALLP